MPDITDRKLMKELADAAFREAAKEVLRVAKQTGTPVIIWEDGQIRHVSPGEIDAREARKSAGVSDSETP